MSVFRNSLRSIFFVFCVCAGTLWGIPARGQKSINAYLVLQGQARLDSLTLWQHSALYDSDSLPVFAEIDVVKRHALKTNDAVLAAFSDQLKGFYLLSGKQKDYKAAYERFKSASKQLKTLPSGSLKNFVAAECEHFMGMALYLTRDDFDKCINHFLAADLAYRKIGYENHLFASYRLTYLSLYYLKIVGDYETALRYLKEGEAYVQKNPVDYHRIQLYRNIALCLVEKKQYAEAVRYNQLGIAQVRTRKDSLRVGALNGNIGEIILNHYPNPIESEPYFRKELLYRLRFDPDKKYDDIAKIYGNLCQIEGYKRNPANVVAYFNKALALLDKNENKTEFYNAQYAIYKNRMIADTLLGDYKSALRYELLCQEALSKLNKQNLQLTASEASVRFDSEKLKLQAELANEQSQNSRFWIVVVSLLLLVALIGGYFLYYRQRTRKDELARQLVFEQKEAERLAELDSLKTRFFANISHEFRTPLTLILSPLKALRKEFPQRDIFQLMQQNAERLLALINQLLDLSKLEAGKMEVQIQQGDLPRFLKYVFASFESLAQNRNILFHYHQNRKHQSAYFDADKLEKIITNLLSNAFKFTPENGRVEVQVEYTEKDLLLQVRDFGIGIEAEHLPRIFDRFYQKDASPIRDYEGTGIGLALVKELVEVLKGKIEAESQIGRGTTFRVQLPIDNQTWQQSPVAVPVAESGYSPAVRVVTVPSSDSLPANDELPILLIVEDSSDLRRYIRSQFEGNYRILEAGDGQEGLIKATEVIPDLVICDLMMPRLDGYGFCKALKTDLRTNHIPVVMLTAKATAEDRLEGLQMGADDYLAKPFHTDELQIRVRNLIAVREKLRQKYSRPLPIAPEADVIPKTTTNEDEFLQKIRQIIEQNLTNPHFEVDLLAEPLKMTSAQLRRKLKALTNHTVVEFIRNYRLDKAVMLLKSKKRTVSEVAYEVGFESLPYFSKIFQDRFGISPSLLHSEGDFPKVSKNTLEK
ncbi:MAG: ATP-binding protein [Spirosomataceae bacterium]